MPRRLTYNYYSYQITTRPESNNVKSIAPYFTGMHSHISVVQNGRRVYLHTLSNTICQRLHEIDTLSLGGSAIISGTSSNSTTTSSINLAGSTTMDGRCSGTQYSDPYETWDMVVMQAIIKIVLRDFEDLIECVSSHLILPSGQRYDAR